MGEDGPRERAQVGGALADRPRRILYGRRRSRKLRAGRAAVVADALPTLEVVLPFELDDAFPPPREVWLEIGFGAGEHLAAQAEANPAVGFLGCEPFFDGVAKLVARIAARGIDNIRIFRDDARLLLEALPEAAIARGFVLFPDPWPKARHHKRRFLSRNGFAQLARVLRGGAELRISTDDPGYLEWIREHAAAEGSFVLEREWRARPASWPATRYEERALAAGRIPAYLAFRRRAK